MPAAHDIYAEQLTECGLGYPLYHPEPEGDWPMEVGDVGFVKNGAFYRLFNATRPAGHPSQRIGVPNDFELLDIGYVRPFEAALEPGPLHSHTVCHVGAMVGVSSPVLSADMSFHFKCTSARGAILMQETEMKREEAAQHRAEEYLRRHRHSIIGFAEANDFGPESGHIMLVIECCKTAAWSMAVYSNNTRDFFVSFSLGNSFVPCAPGFSASAGVGRLGPIQRRKSIQRPAHAASDQQPPKNQTVFFKAAHLGKRQSVYRNLFSLFIGRDKNKKYTRAFTGAKSSGFQPRKSSPDSPSAFLPGPIEIPANWELPDFHPVVPLLAQAMEDTDEDYAIVFDDKWCFPTEETSQLIKEYAQFHFEMADSRARDLVSTTEPQVSRSISTSQNITQRIDSSDYPAEYYSKGEPSAFFVDRAATDVAPPSMMITGPTLERGPEIDYISVLNTIGQRENKNIDYKYRSNGSPHVPLWTSRVHIDGKLYGEGLGSTKRDAKMLAAKQAWIAFREGQYMAL